MSFLPFLMEWGLGRRTITFPNTYPPTLPPIIPHLHSYPHVQCRRVWAEATNLFSFLWSQESLNSKLNLNLNTYFQLYVGISNLFQYYKILRRHKFKQQEIVEGKRWYT